VPSRVIGVLSDTHNKVRPEAVRALRGAEAVIHAGDVCRRHVLDELEALGPLWAVRGNNDREAWARRLPLSRTIRLAGYRLHVIHDLKELDVDPVAKGFDAVISGHSHRPNVERQSGVLYLNPGSAGPRRFRLPVTVARLYLGEKRLTARIVELDV